MHFIILNVSIEVEGQNFPHPGPKGFLAPEVAINDEIAIFSSANFAFIMKKLPDLTGRYISSHIDNLLSLNG